MTTEPFPYADWTLLGVSALLSAVAWRGVGIRAQGLAGIWFAGCFFGLALGALHLEDSELILSLAIVSGASFAAAFTLAVKIHRYQHFSLFSPLTLGQQLHNRGVEALAGAVAGAFGASVVSAAVKLAAGVALAPPIEAFQAAVGALCGVLFFQADRLRLPHWLASPLAFVLWQFPVGLILGASMDLVPPDDRSLLVGAEFRAFLGGPTVQLIGLIGSVASVVSLLHRRPEPLGKRDT